MPRLRMVRTNAQGGKQQLQTARTLASAVRFNRNEYRVNVFERLGIVGLQHPSLLAGVVFVENAQAARLFVVGTLPPPGLERLGILKPRLCIQVERVKN